jgi:hypothetical protein
MGEQVGRGIARKSSVDEGFCSCGRGGDARLRALCRPSQIEEAIEKLPAAFRIIEG